MISIIIPVYNRIEAFEKTLLSIFEQSYTDWEIIVVDDGSEQNIQENHAIDCSGKKIKWIRQENAGAPAARNKGLAESKGNFVIFWDADIVADPLMLEKMHKKLENNPGASYVYCDISFGDKFMLSKDWDYDDLKHGNYIHTTSLIRKREAIPFDESLKRFQDWDLWLTMAEQGKRGIYLAENLFTVIEDGTISKHLPSFAYKIPFRWFPWWRRDVRKYFVAKSIVQNKHESGVMNSEPSSAGALITPEEKKEILEELKHDLEEGLEHMEDFAEDEIEEEAEGMEEKPKKATKKSKSRSAKKKSVKKKTTKAAAKKSDKEVSKKEPAEASKKKIAKKSSSKSSKSKK